MALLILKHCWLLLKPGVSSSHAKMCGNVRPALWDRRDYTLQLARDRLGKASVLGFEGSGDHRSLLFGSDLAALRAWPGFK